MRAVAGALPPVAAPETGRADVCGDPAEVGRRGHQHRVHLGPSLPPEPAGTDGRGLGTAGGRKAVMPGDLKKLVGGYATGTLTPEERQALFQAALEDQGLFDALAREEALRDVLSDRAARARLLAALDGQPAPWYRRAWSVHAVTRSGCRGGVGDCGLGGLLDVAFRTAARCYVSGGAEAGGDPRATGAQRRTGDVRGRCQRTAGEGRGVCRLGGTRLRRNAARSDAAQPAAPTAHAGAQSSSGAMGSLVPARRASAGGDAGQG